MKSEKVVIVDIDGTIAKLGDRLKYLNQEPADWDSFYLASGEDEPIQVIIDLVNVLKNSYTIVYCTGRSEKARDVTKKWLAKHVYNIRIS